VIGNGYFSGSVGIGTTSPSAKLHVKESTIDEVQVLLENDGGIIRQIIGTSSIASNPSLRFRNNGVTIMTLSDDGNVGIGTTSPGGALQVVGSHASTNKAEIRLTKAYSGGSQTLAVLGTGSSTYLENNERALLQMYDVGAEKIRLYTAGDSYFNGGNVGIGTTSPGALLHLSKSTTGDGTFLTSGMLIQSTGDPDGEVALSYRVKSTTDVGNYWMTGLNQSDIYKIAYGPSFTDANVKLTITATSASALRPLLRNYM